MCEVGTREEWWNRDEFQQEFILYLLCCHDSHHTGDSRIHRGCRERERVRE